MPGIAVVDIPSNVVPYFFGIGGAPPGELTTRAAQDAAEEAEEALEPDEDEEEEEEGGSLEFQVVSFTLHDGLSTLGRLELQVMSPSSDEIPVEEVIGQRAWFAWACGTEMDRTFLFFHGIVTSFAETGRDTTATFYQVVVVPRLWRTAVRTRSRIFQNQSVPEIIQKVLKDHELLVGQDVTLAMTGAYEPRKYCVQYRESDFNFISRLMEEEGIYYYVDQKVNTDVLVLVDALAAHKPAIPYDSVVVQTSDAGEVLTEAAEATAEALEPDLETGDLDGATLEERIQSFRFTHTLPAGKVQLLDYNFQNSNTKPTGEEVGVLPAEPEVYDYPGRFYDDARGKLLAGIRMQELDAQTRVAHGKSDFRSLAAGRKFTILDHPRESFNRGYLCTAVTHFGTQRSQIDAEGKPVGMGGTTYENGFVCIPDDLVYRPLRLTPKPVITGIQTAKVVGPPGEEIYTDEFLRIKVQFHWDREGKEDENSSCWVRVAQKWADGGFGMVVIPRIGTEALVEFVEGDPDRPIVNGCLYNDQHMPALSLPGQKMCTGFKSNSTPGGGGDNELTFDDTKGNEKITMHGQYDMSRTIGHDDTIDIGNNQTQTIGVDRTESVGSNEKITIGANRDETVGANETITIGANRTENVGANESITVALNRTRNVGVAELINIGAAQAINVGAAQATTVGAVQANTIGSSQTNTIGASQTTTVGANRSASVAGDDSTNVGKNQSTNVGDNQVTKVGKDCGTQAGQDVSVKAGKKFLVDAGDSVSIETGKSLIQMKKNGDILIQGKNITIKASGKIVMKGNKILEN